MTEQEIVGHELSEALSLFKNEKLTLAQTHNKIISLFPSTKKKRDGCCRKNIISCFRLIWFSIKSVVVLFCIIGVVVFIMSLAFKIYPMIIF